MKYIKIFQILNLQKAAIERKHEEERQLKEYEAEWLVSVFKITKKS